MGALETLIVGVLIIIFGFAVWIMGYSIWRIALALMGAVYGYIIGSSLVAPEQWLLALIIGVVVAIVLALVAYFLWSIVAVIYGMLLGAGIAFYVAMLLPFVEQGGLIMWVFVIVGAIIGLVLAYLLKDRVIMLITAFAGAGAILYGAQMLLPQFFDFLVDPTNYVIAFVIWAVAGIIGFMIQNALFSGRLTDTYAGYGSAYDSSATTTLP
jgi:hypothetical protein